jgi:propanediol utilization protein
MDVAAHRVPVAISARHAHLTQASLDRLFGAGHALRPLRPLHQPGQFAAEETVSLVGPAGRLDGVRLIGPPRDDDQVELSRSDALHLGIEPPLRASGDLAGSAGITVEGPAGSVALREGVICALCHVHMGSADARRLGIANGARVSVRVAGEGREVVFRNVLVRVSPDFETELHLDTDEANAAGVFHGGVAELLLQPGGD